VLHGGVTASFQHVEGPGHVAVDVSLRILERVAHARLRRQVHDPREALAREQCADLRGVRQIELHEAEGGVAFEPLEARLLEGDVVVLVEIIETHHLVTLAEQPLRRRRPDEPGGACDQDLHNLPSTCAAGNRCLMS